ncbi:MAG: ArsA family ATPase [Gemmatimonadota bacterium]|uniref:AAA+ ATPase domain-containing protein n=1 Tax=marine metagenome TaxID=408172 RepID=A0A381NW47_9ZZZZ|nr:ArsA family ATPase [Gemmatimonadota bacterium]|tara:strand:- start:247 stop:1257 length:1011 start_codon:yes stop_codon:yes gene_type:complete
MNSLPLEGHSILFVGGKGGVGKSTTAASLAVHLADSGEKILLVSTDPAHSLGDLFETSVGDRKREIVPGLHALEIDPGQEVEKYLARVKSTMRHYVQPAMYSEIERQIELTRHSPGAEEAALMDRVTTLMQEGATSHDRIIFDTAPTGHTLRLLALPEIMAAWTTGLLKSRERSDSLGKAVDRLRGREQASGDELAWFDDVKEEVTDERTQKIQEVLLERQRRFSKARRLLLDPEITAFILVLIPEKLPILESEKTHAVLRQHKIPVAGLVVNRTLPENQVLGEFLESRRSQEAEYLEQIERVFSKLPRVRIPLLSRDVQGINALREIAQHLLIDK